MISAATGMFLTEATDTPIGLAVMLLWWFLDLNGNIFQMGGGYAGFSLCPRHNSILGAQVLPITSGRWPQTGSCWPPSA